MPQAPFSPWATVAAIYEGVSSADRSIRTDNDGAVAYVQITAVSGNTYTYKTADSADVPFTPDVLLLPDRIRLGHRRQCGQ